MKMHTYPADHMWRDLEFSMEYDEKKRCIIRAPVAPGLCSDLGTLQVGFVSTLFDLVGGELAARTAYPDWIATADLVLCSRERARGGEFTAVASVVRAGRSSIVIEADMLATPGPGAAPLSIGSAMAAFTRLKSREDTAQVARVDGPHQVFSLEGRVPARRILDKAGLRVVDEAGGVVEIAMSEYIRNAFHGLHGGVFGLLADAAGQCAARAASGLPLVTTDLAIHYLSMGKTGPFRTRASIVRAAGDSVLTRIDMVDAGKQDLLMAVAFNTATLA